MKNQEQNLMNMGRMMIMGAMIEARVFQKENSKNEKDAINTKILKVIIGCLIDLFKSCEFLQESIIANFSKVVGQLKEFKDFGIQAIEIIMEQLIIKKNDS